MGCSDELDDIGRESLLSRRIREKGALRQLYQETYQKFAACIERCPVGGQIIELGSGGGFAKEVIPQLTTTDVLDYSSIDRVVDATRMPFTDNSLRCILLYDVFHHIPAVESFLREAERCLKPGGRIFMVDMHPGLIGKPILKYGHHEAFDDETEEWAFEASGPLSSANGALAWMVFRRDRNRLSRVVPGLRLLHYTPHTPLRYWLSGGLKWWSLLPGFAFNAATRIDRLLTGLHAELGCFVDIELVKLRENNRV